MASKRGQRRREQRKVCGNKVKYIDQTMAVSALISLKKRKKEDNIKSYRCKHCGNWHIGHIPRFTMSSKDADKAWSKRLGD